MIVRPSNKPLLINARHCCARLCTFRTCKQWSHRFILTRPRRPSHLFSARISSVPTFCISRKPSLERQKLSHQSFRSFSSNQHHGFIEESNSDPALESSQPSASTSQATTDKWNSRLDPYLPLQLRSKSWLDNLAAFEGVRSVESLPQILREASLDYPQTIFAHLGLVQGKWDAITWLSKELISYKYPEALDLAKIVRHNKIWAEVDGFSPSLAAHDDILNLDSKPLQPCELHEKLDALTRDALVSSRKSYSLWHSTIGQIWQSLGHIVIKASNLEIQDGSRMMAFVYQTIAQIHTEGVASPLIYQFDSADDPSPISKSPFLHLMSSRIMAALSDAMWKLTEPKLMGDAALVAATYAYQGREMPGSELNPRVRSLGPEVWLEFILWSCIHGSHFFEAGKIIEDANRQEGSQRWKTKGWGELRETLNQNLAEKARKGHIRSWFDRIAGASEGYSNEAPAIALGERTLSREVVTAAANGLTSVHCPDADRHMQSSEVLPLVQSCRSMACDNPTPSESLLWDTISHKLLEDSNDATLRHSESVSSKLKLADDAERYSEGESREKHTSLAREITHNRTSSLHPILLQALDLCVRNRDIAKSNKCFEKLRGWADTHLRELSDDDLPDSRGSQTVFASLTAYIPNHVIAALLNTISETKAYGFGKMLLPLLGPPNEPGIVRGPGLFESTLLESSILRFANATRDTSLEESIMSRPDWNAHLASHNTIRELLHSQCVARRWDYVETLLSHLQFDRRVALSALDVARIASPLMIPLLPGDNARVIDEEHYHILASILNREYLPPRDYSQSRDYRDYRTLNQMSRLLSSVPGTPELHSLAKQHIHNHGPASNPIILPTAAFNALLWRVVRTYGVPAGQDFFSKWCITSRSRPSPPQNHNAETNELSSRALTSPSAKCVQPTMQTLRILISYPLCLLQERVEDNLSFSSAARNSLPKELWRRSYQAWRELPETSRVKREIGWAVAMSEKSELEAPGVFEQLLRRVSREEIRDGEGENEVEATRPQTEAGEHKSGDVGGEVPEERAEGSVDEIRNANGEGAGAA